MKVLAKGRTASRVCVRTLGLMFAFGFPTVRKIDYVAFPLRFLSAFVLLLNEEDFETKNFVISFREFLVIHFSIARSSGHLLEDTVYKFPLIILSP